MEKSNAVHQRLERLFEASGITNRDHQSLYLHLIKSNEDFNEFMKDFHTGNVTDIIKYQRYKRKSERLSFEEFEMLFKKDRKDALEKLFHEPILEHQKDYMESYNVSAKELYKRYENNSNLNYLSLVKSASMKPISNDDFLLDRF